MKPVMQLNLSADEEIFVRIDINDVRRSLFCQLLPNDIIVIEQTKPPVNKNHLSKTVLLTFKISGKKIGRCGFEARIREITNDDRIVLQKLNDPAPCDLRVWPRICLDLLPDVRAFCCDKEIQIIDISGGGAHIIAQNIACAASEGSIINMRFIFNKGEVTVECRIVRKWRDASDRDHLAVQFQGNHNMSQYIY
jgi:hypothetical protein